MPQAGLKVLLIKTSSMGDLVHTLSAVEEARMHLPTLEIDWVCEEAFVDLPRLSLAVRRVIPVALRRWKKNWWSAAHRQERKAFKADLQRASYDLVIDAQGLIKSAWILRMARVQSKARWGYDWSSAREPLASLVLDHKVRAPRHLHAIERLRILFSQALHYTRQGGPSTLDLIHHKALSSPADGSRSESFAWPLSASVSGAVGSIPRPFVLFLHGTSRAEKEWPIKVWIELGKNLSRAGFHVALPWGSAQEQNNAQQIAAGIAADQQNADVGHAQAIMLPRLKIAELIHVLNDSAGAVGVDSGLMHLSVVLGKPTVAIMSAAHQPRFAAERFAPFWAAHARVVATKADHPRISADQVFHAWSELIGAPR